MDEMNLEFCYTFEEAQEYISMAIEAIQKTTDISIVDSCISDLKYCMDNNLVKHVRGKDGLVYFSETDLNFIVDYAINTDEKQLTAWDVISATRYLNAISKDKKWTPRELKGLAVERKIGTINENGYYYFYQYDLDAYYNANYYTPDVTFKDWMCLFYIVLILVIGVAFVLVW